MEYTVKALADLAGVTPRTLRWYDRIGLLKPLRTTEAGYRLYGPAQLDRLQDILFYRAGEFCTLGVERDWTWPRSGPFWTTRPLTARRRCRATWQSWRPVGPDWTI